MTVHFEPCTYSGEIKAPPSKSAAHRLLICAGLSAGESRIDGIYDSDDISATLDCLAASGAVIRRRGGSAAVRGADPRGRTRCVFGCRESGSTLRFLLPVALLSDSPRYSPAATGCSPGRSAYTKTSAPRGASALSGRPAASRPPGGSAGTRSPSPGTSRASSSAVCSLPFPSRRRTA